METLSSLDATFLHAESANVPMNVVGTMILEAHPDLTYDAVVRRLHQRLPLLPAFTRRVAETPMGVDRPVWIDDPDIDVRNHVLRVMAPSPGGQRELAQLVARTAAEPLDRREPLWQLWMVEGLEDNRVALLRKAHHAAFDGVSGAAILVQLFDGAEDDLSEGETVNERLPVQWLVSEPEPRVGLSGFARHTVGRVPRRIADQVGALRQAGTALFDFAKKRLEDGETFPRLSSLIAPASPFNVSLSARRTIGYARNSMGRVQQVRDQLGGTINDVVLAACTEALRDYLLLRNQLPDRALIAAIPVSTRDVERDGFGGNRLSAMRVELPVHIEDPVERYENVRLNARTAKRLHAILGAETLESIAKLVSPPALKAALDLYTRLELANLHAPVVNLTISNVAGPPTPLTFCGATLENIHPHGPLMEGIALNITVASYAGTLGIGVLGCKTAVPHAEEIADGITNAIERLAKCAEPDSREV